MKMKKTILQSYNIFLKTLNLHPIPFGRSIWSPTHKNGEEEHPCHPTAGHEEDLWDVLRLLVFPNRCRCLCRKVETPDWSTKNQNDIRSDSEQIFSVGELLRTKNTEFLCFHIKTV